MRRLMRGLHRPPSAQVDRPAERHRSDGDEVLHRQAFAQVSEERDQRTRQLQRPRRAGGLSVTTPRLIRPQELLLWVDRLGASVLRRQIPLPLLGVRCLGVLQRGSLHGRGGAGASRALARATARRAAGRHKPSAGRKSGTPNELWFMKGSLFITLTNGSVAVE